jgi:hypothetical protein
VRPASRMRARSLVHAFTVTVTDAENQHDTAQFA